MPRAQSSGTRRRPHDRRQAQCAVPDDPHGVDHGYRARHESLIQGHDRDTCAHGADEDGRQDSQVQQASEEHEVRFARSLQDLRALRVIERTKP